MRQLLPSRRRVKTFIRIYQGEMEGDLCGLVGKKNWRVGSGNFDTSDNIFADNTGIDYYRHWVD